MLFCDAVGVEGRSPVHLGPAARVSGAAVCPWQALPVRAVALTSLNPSGCAVRASAVRSRPKAVLHPVRVRSAPLGALRPLLVLFRPLVDVRRVPRLLSPPADGGAGREQRGFASVTRALRGGRSLGSFLLGTVGFCCAPPTVRGGVRGVVPVRAVRPLCGLLVSWCAKSQTWRTFSRKRVGRRWSGFCSGRCMGSGLPAFSSPAASPGRWRGLSGSSKSEAGAAANCPASWFSLSWSEMLCKANISRLLVAVK